MSNNAENANERHDQDSQAAADNERVKDITEGGDIGDEQLPAGEIKTDKCAWSYAADKILKVQLPKKLKKFLDGL